MQSVETENQGLKRAFTLTIPAADIDARVAQEVTRMAPQIRMPGFRPGKVPANLIKKMHGPALQQEALNTAIQSGVQQLLSEKGLRPAMQPQIALNGGYEPGKDAEISVSLETLPQIPTPQIEGLKLERLMAPVDEAALEAQIKQLAGSQKRWEDAGDKVAETGDQLTIDFVGKVDGVPFEGGTGTDMAVELGSGSLIPGFEEQLVGIKAGEERVISLTFPADYPSEKLKGAAATFDISVKTVKTAGEMVIDDDFAKQLGLQSLEQLQGLLRGQAEQELNGLTRTHMKRRLLDQLASSHDFEVPPSMVEAEYANIRQQLEHEASHEADPAAALEELNGDEAEYRKIAERRVRLGLLLSEIGSANGVEVNQQEMNRLIGQAAQQYDPKERERFVQYVQQDPMAAAQLRAPLYEDKVVDFLFSKAEITDRPATRAEIEADLEAEEGHVHGPDCGHDHAAAPAVIAKPAKAKKAAKPAKDAAPEAAEASAEAPAAKVAKPKAAKPIKGAVEAEPAKPVPAEPIKDHAPAKPRAAKKAPKA
jgi:trigger factor